MLDRPPLPQPHLEGSDSGSGPRKPPGGEAILSSWGFASARGIDGSRAVCGEGGRGRALIADPRVIGAARQVEDLHPGVQPRQPLGRLPPRASKSSPK